jgi:hypothetical protein
LVLAVIAQVYELSEHRTQPWYIDRSALDLGHASDGAGEPPQGVAITADGVRLLEECGLV